MLTRAELDAAIQADPPPEATEAYIREAVAARPEATLKERVTMASYLDAVVIQTRGELDDEARAARLMRWVEVTGAIKTEAVIAEELLGGESSS